MRFKTTIIKKGDKQEQRNVDWWLPLGRWQLGERTLLESDVQGINEVIELRDFHANRKGSKQGFRFKDWSDYKATNQHLGTADGQQDQWQLKKTYFAGEYQTHRPITKPVSGTVKIYLDDIEAVGGWSVDYSTGVLSFDTPPPELTEISCAFEFDVPVWFETDEFSYTLQGYQKNPQTDEVEAIYRLGNLAVEEGRIPLALPWYHLEPLPQQLTTIFDLGIIPETLLANIFNTSKETLVSGYTRKDSNISNPEVEIKLPQKIYNQAEIEQLLGFFWHAKARAVNIFLTVNNLLMAARFNDDILNIKFLATDGNESMYSSNFRFHAEGACNIGDSSNINFSDGEFLAENWSSEVIIAGNIASSSAELMIERADNDNRLYRITNYLNPQGIYTSVWAMYLQKNFIIEPKYRGKIIRIQYSERSRYSGTSYNLAGQANGIAIKQNNKFYLGGYSVTGENTSWTTKQVNLSEQDFSEITIENNQIEFNSTSHPNFSFGASLLQLGFYRANSGIGTRTIIADIDDISFNIDFACTI